MCNSGVILGIWRCKNGNYYYHLVATNEVNPTEQKMWEELDYALAFHKGNGIANDFTCMMANLVKPEDLQMLREAIAEGRTDK